MNTKKTRNQSKRETPDCGGQANAKEAIKNKISTPNISSSAQKNTSSFEAAFACWCEEQDVIMREFWADIADDEEADHV